MHGAWVVPATGVRGEGLHQAGGRSQRGRLPLPSGSFQPPAGFWLCWTISYVPLHLLLCPNRAPTPGFVPPLHASPGSLSLFSPCPHPSFLQRAPSPTSSYKPRKATAVLNPKSCQLNRSLRLWLRLLTSGDPGEARPPPTRVGLGEATPPSPGPAAVGQSAGGHTSPHQTQAPPVGPRSRRASHSWSPTFCPDPAHASRTSPRSRGPRLGRRSRLGSPHLPLVPRSPTWRQDPAWAPSIAPRARGRPPHAKSANVAQALPLALQLRDPHSEFPASQRPQCAPSTLRAPTAHAPRTPRRDPAGSPALPAASAPSVLGFPTPSVAGSASTKASPWEPGGGILRAISLRTLGSDTLINNSLKVM